MLVHDADSVHLVKPFWLPDPVKKSVADLEEKERLDVAVVNMHSNNKHTFVTMLAEADDPRTRFRHYCFQIEELQKSKNHTAEKIVVKPASACYYHSPLPFLDDILSIFAENPRTIPFLGRFCGDVHLYRAQERQLIDINKKALDSMVDTIDVSTHSPTIFAQSFGRHVRRVSDPIQAPTEYSMRVEAYKLGADAIVEYRAIPAITGIGIYAPEIHVGLPVKFID